VRQAEVLQYGWNVNRAGKSARKTARRLYGEALRLVVIVFGVNSVFGPSFGSAQITNALTPTNALPVLTNVQQVLDLGSYRARQLHQPVRLRGTVLTVSRVPVHIILHDGKACILIANTNLPADLTVGKLAEAEGRTEAGLRAPIVDRAGVRVIGDSTIPEGTPMSASRLMAGEGCWQWVRVEGVVRDMNRDRSNIALSIASEGRRFTAFIYGYSRFSRIGLPLEWLEARVQLDGVCWTDVNDWNEPVEFHLGLPHTNQLRFLGPGNTNLFGLPALRATDVARLRRPSDERLKITGTVLAHFSDDRIFLETEFGAVQTRMSAPISRGMPSTEVVPREPAPLLEAGERVDLVGAPAESLFAPLLVDAEFRRTGRGTSPAPTAATIGALSSGQHDAGLVRLIARLLTRERRKSGSVFEDALVLEAGETVFEASWRTGTTNTLPPIPINARLELDGICLVQPGPANLRRTFKILLRNPGDVRYLGQAPFWMRPGAARALGVSTIIGLGAAMWIWLLRRQVRERTAALATANTRMSVEIEERKRAQTELDRALAAERELGELKSRFVSLVSHEFRTPLGITMSAVELLRNYLDRLPPAKLKELLEDIYTSTLRMSGLMEQMLLLGRVEAGKLGFNFAPLDVAALGRKLVDETLSATNRKCPVQFQSVGDFTNACGDESLLRHIFSNLLSNAVKYSTNGGSVEFTVQRAGSDALFTVCDCGIGIPETDQARLFEAFHRAANVSQIPGTGLGLLIVKRCVELHGGTIAFESHVGTGTTFTVRLPLFANS